MTQLIASVVSYIVKESTDPKGAILVFMPGVQEIQRTMESIRSQSGVGGQLEIMPLHANLTSDEQKRVFQSTTRRKVVVATNVAEVS